MLCMCSLHRAALPSTSQQLGIFAMIAVADRICMMQEGMMVTSGMDMAVLHLLLLLLPRQVLDFKIN